ncbi:TraR/DksA C4-type zinc finger protein [Thalassobaculum sp. OXR-137]|uniref:TraR/DksA family transcriptional regulator n=1 Tax=Thalassobaculum sp. OXR-137 TaxID=3100173 RepID=UPI002AC95847|nr:TraR/DksA C4-type zinc finger protein [Thalassobaculum sp. OXR-137]WPZ36434.1 TraR/DksA C4-type zinc finger protein [Thalassobaculum sp. OXR-137]
MSPMQELQFDTDDDDAVRHVLTERRAEIEALMAGSKEARGAVELDQSRVGRLSRMDAIQDQAMALETDRRRTLELQRIGSALKRLAAGEYGSCVRCGEEIEAARLGSDPAATICMDCADS